MTEYVWADEDQDQVEHSCFLMSRTAHICGFTLHSAAHPTIIERVCRCVLINVLLLCLDKMVSHRWFQWNNNPGPSMVSVTSAKQEQELSK